MDFTEIDWYLHKTHYEKLLQIATEERLVRQANRAGLERKATGHEAIQALATLLIRWGNRLLQTGDLGNAACLSILVANSPNKEASGAKLCC